MSMHNGTGIAVFTACCLTVVGVSSVNAAHHEEDMVKAKIGEFYGHLTAGNFEGFFEFIKSGSSGYMPHGLLSTPLTDTVKPMAIASMTEEWEEGVQAKIQPKHLSISMLGEHHALATYYAEGTEVDEVDGPEEHVLNRVTLVLEKDGDDWAIVHWHVSELQRDEE